MRRGTTGYQRLAALGLALILIAALVIASLTLVKVSHLSGEVASLAEDVTRADAKVSDLSGQVASLAEHPVKATRSATKIVAASNSSAQSKAGADYVATGTNDQVELQAAIDALPANGGKIILSTGQFNISSPIRPTKWEVTIQGMGVGSDGKEVTLLKLANGANCNMFESPDTTWRTLILRDLTLDGNRNNNTSGNGILLDYIGLGTMADPSIGVEIKFFAEDGIRSTQPHSYIFASYIYIRGNVSYGIIANMIQGSLMNDIYLTSNEKAGISAAFNDSIVSGLYLESNGYWGGVLNPTTSVLKIWAGNNSRGATPFVPAEVYAYNATNHTIILNIDRSSQSKPNIHGLYLQNNVSGNTIKGHIGATGYSMYLDTGALGWDPTGTVIEGSVLDGTLGGFNVTPPASMLVRNNTGYITENSGSTTIAAGNTSVAVSHGLAGTPVTVQLTPTTDTAGKRYWVSNKGPSTFTLTIDSAYTSGIAFDWKAEMY